MHYDEFYASCHLFFVLFSGGAWAVALAGLPHEILLDPTWEIP
jgi:hypothetical protein